MAAVTYTVANGETRTSRSTKNVYTHALVLFNPAEAHKAPHVKSFHTRIDLAVDAAARWVAAGYRYLVVPVTTDGSRDEQLARDIADLRTAEDIANIPAQRIAEAEAAVARAEESVKHNADRATKGPRANQFNGVTYETQEQLDTLLVNSMSRLANLRDELATVLAEYAPEPVPVEKPKKARKLGRKARFVRDVTETILRTAPDSNATGATVDDMAIEVGRGEDSVYTDLTVVELNGNSFEINYPFTAKNAKRIATLLWELRSTMAL